MKENADKKLWDDFREGENYALSHIYYQHIQSLFRYGKKFSKDDDFVKDAIQELFFDLICTRKQLGSTDNISYYLIASLRRRIARNLKKSKVLLNASLKIDLEADIVYSVEQEIIAKEERSEQDKLLQRGLAELTRNQREILYYKYTCDFSYEQICELMSLKYDSARKLVFRAIGSLRAALEDKKSMVLFLGWFRKEKIT